MLEKCNIIVSNIYECSFMWFEEDYRRFKINWTKLDKLNETNMKLSETDMKPPETTWNLSETGWKSGISTP